MPEYDCRDDGGEYAEYFADKEARRQCVHQFQRARMPLIEVDAGAAGIEHLTEKFAEVGAAFVIDKGFLDQLSLKTAFQNPERHIDVLAKTHCGKSVRRLQNLARKSHVETPRMKFPRLFARAAYAAGADY